MEKCGVPGKYGVKWSECIYTEIHQKWSSDISIDRSHWDPQPCRNKSKNSYQFQLLFQSESLTNFDWNCSVLLAILRCFECFRVLLFLSCVGWLTIDSRMWAVFLGNEKQNLYQAWKGDSTFEASAESWWAGQVDAMLCFSAAISFLASVSLFPTKYFSLIITGIWFTTRAFKWATEWLITLNR